MDGGRADERGAHGAGIGDDLSRLIAAKRALDRADAERLATGAPFVAEALSRLAVAIDDLQSIRWAALSGEHVASAVRGLHAQQSRLDAAVLAPVNAIDERDDVVPRARARTAGAQFLHHALGLDRRVAARHAGTARLLRADGGDLSGVGAAYAAGVINRGHVDVAASVHHRLHARVRDQLIPVVDPETREQSGRRCIEVVDAMLARQAEAVGVPELKRIADRVVEHLDPPSPDDAHERRYLHLSQLPDGSLIGKFACGGGQALGFQAVIAAGAAPQPGRAVDHDGVEYVLPDERTAGQRRMDALADALATAAGGAVSAADSSTGSGGGPRAAATDADPPAEPAEEAHEPAEEAHEPAEEAHEPAEEMDEPAREGEEEIRHHPGIRSGPYPPAEIIVTATLDQLAAALALARQHAGSTACLEGGPPGLWPDAEPPDPAADSHADMPNVGEPDQPVDDLHAAEGFARAQHGGPVHPRTLRLLACSARLRTVLLDRHGAVLDLGRTQRLASHAQRRALLARDGGCTIPGCHVPGELCDIHHPTPWAHGGSTDIHNLALLCRRHHGEVHDPGGWQIEMIQGIPWVRPPAWIRRDRPLLRNTTHRSAAGAG